MFCTLIAAFSPPDHEQFVRDALLHILAKGELRQINFKRFYYLVFENVFSGDFRVLIFKNFWTSGKLHTYNEEARGGTD